MTTIYLFASGLAIGGIITLVAELKLRKKTKSPEASEEMRVLLKILRDMSITDEHLIALNHSIKSLAVEVRSIGQARSDVSSTGGDHDEQKRDTAGIPD